VNAAAAPTLPLVIAASFSALVAEAYIALSLRVHQLESAGVPVEPSSVVRDTLRAMTGREDASLSKAAMQSLTRRMLRRWSRGVVPFVGVGYSAWDARKTIRAITRLPYDAATPSQSTRAASAQSRSRP
jgi:hypothetical protein